METVIRFSFFYLYTFYAYIRLLHISVSSKKKLLQICLCIPALTGLSCALKFYLPACLQIISVLVFSVFTMLLFRTRADLSLMFTTISFAISNVAFYIGSLLVAMFVALFFRSQTSVPLTLMVLLSSFLALAVVYFLFRIRRLQKGMLFLQNTKILSAGLVLSLFILILQNIDQIYSFSTLALQTLLPLSMFVLAFLLFSWWRRQLTRNYMRRLQKNEIESLYEELKEKEALIRCLKEDNAALSKIIHRDNKLIPAMEHAVTAFLQTTSDQTGQETMQYGNELIAQLHAMSHDRKGILDAYQQQDNPLVHTGKCRIDALLAYMQKKSAENGIGFSMRYHPDAFSKLFSLIPEEALSRLLADLLENAIIATRKSTTRSIQLQFGFFQNFPLVSVSDSGEMFDLQTIQKLGIKQHTTHLSDGGSGIGWMDIWALKKKYHISLQMQEYRNHRDSFTKKISFVFDNKNHYIIQSYRYADILSTQTRGDLYVLPYDIPPANEGGLSTNGKKLENSAC